MKKYICLIFVIASFSCSKKNKISLSYKLNWYTFNESETTKESTPFIVHDKLVVEFLLKYNYIRKVNIKTNTSKDTLAVDTTGYRLIFPENNFFLEIDRFLPDFKVLKKGKLNEMTDGYTIAGNNNDLQIIFDHTLKDTIINHQPLKYFDSTVTEKSEKELQKFEMKYFFIENKDFNTIFKIKGLRHKDKNMCFAGYYLATPYNRESQIVLAEDVVILAKQQEKVCESVFKKAIEYLK